MLGFDSPAASAIWSKVDPRKPYCENTSSPAAMIAAWFFFWMRDLVFGIHGHALLQNSLLRPEPAN